MPPLPALPKSELEVLRTVWRTGESTVRDVVDAISQERQVDFWTVQTYLRRLTEKGVMNAPVRDYSELLDDAHVKSIELIHWFEQPGFARVPLARVPGVDVDWALPAPALGEHNEEILAELISRAGSEV